jgi:hypothetical protein
MTELDNDISTFRIAAELIRKNKIAGESKKVQAPESE